MNLIEIWLLCGFACYLYIMLLIVPGSKHAQEVMEEAGNPYFVHITTLIVLILGPVCPFLSWLVKSQD